MIPLPELSIIIPTLNEATALPRCLAMLARQRDVRYEVLVCDGGSTDTTAQQLSLAAAEGPYPCRLLGAPRGRGAQMNYGAAHARAASLLFLHVDSDFPDPLALRRALDSFDQVVKVRGDERVALHFSLTFAADGLPPAARRFHEAKARLSRPGCIHGDQGLLLRREWFFSLGRFDESLPYLEDDRLAAAVFAADGEWLLSGEEIVTSARRFSVEGWRRRQCVNALILAAEAIGWRFFLQSLPQLYAAGKPAGKLAVVPVLNFMARELAQLPKDARRRLWMAAGEYVRGNVWQVLVWWWRERSPDELGRALERFDRCWERLSGHRAGRLATRWLVRWTMQAIFLLARLAGDGQPAISRYSR